MSRWDQYPLTQEDFDAAQNAALYVHHPPLPESERKDLVMRRIRLGKPGYWKPRSLRSASAASGYSRHRRKSRRRKSHRRKLHRRKSHRRKLHRRKSRRRKSHIHRTMR